LLAIRKLNAQYGHIQEVIIQPVVENDRWDGGSASVETLRRTVAMARYALPETVSVQVPPNLAPAGAVVDCGIDDLGGVSPITTDHVNPKYAWPALQELQSIATEAGVPLTERLPVYDSYLPTELRRAGFRGPAADPPTSSSADMWVSERCLETIRKRVPDDSLRTQSAE
jgi:FO synthase subunit 1